MDAAGRAGDAVRRYRKMLPQGAAASPLYPRAWWRASVDAVEEHARAGGGVRLRVAHFNVLADSTCTTAQDMGELESSPAHALPFQYRRWRLLEEMMRHGDPPDVIALQAVDHFEDWFEPELRKLGYEGRFVAPRGSQAARQSAAGCALFWRTAVLMLDYVRTLNFGATTSRLQACGEVALLGYFRLRHHAQRDPVVVAAARFASGCQADGERVRKQQVHQLLDHLQAELPNQHVILACDLESDPRSVDVGPEAYALFQKHQLCMQSAYKDVLGSEPVCTHRRPRSPDSGHAGGRRRREQVSHCFDYIFTTNNVGASQVLLPPSDRTLEGCSSLPDWMYPSNHFLLMADLLVLDAPRRQGGFRPPARGRSQGLASTPRRGHCEEVPVQMEPVARQAAAAAAAAPFRAPREGAGPSDPVHIQDDARWLRAIFKKVLVHAQLDDQALNLILSRTAKTVGHEGDILLKQGAVVSDHKPAFFVLDSGCLQILQRSDQKANELIKELRQRGDSVGWKALLDGSAQATTVMVSQPSKVYSVTRAVVDDAKIEARARRLGFVMEVLRERGIWPKIGSDEQWKLAKGLQRQEFRKGDQIVREGAAGGFFYVLMSGSVAAYRGKQFIRQQSAGDYFGELALLYEQPRTASIVAAEDCVCAALDRDNFLRLLAPRMAQQGAGRYEEGSASCFQSHCHGSRHGGEEPGRRQSAERSSSRVLLGRTAPDQGAAGEKSSSKASPHDKNAGGPSRETQRKLADPHRRGGTYQESDVGGDTQAPSSNARSKVAAFGDRSARQGAGSASQNGGHADLRPAARHDHLDRALDSQDRAPQSAGSQPRATSGRPEPLERRWKDDTTVRSGAAPALRSDGEGGPRTGDADAPRQPLQRSFSTATSGTVARGSVPASGRQSTGRSAAAARCPDAAGEQAPGSETDGSEQSPPKRLPGPPGKHTLHATHDAEIDADCTEFLDRGTLGASRLSSQFSQPSHGQPVISKQHPADTTMEGNTSKVPKPDASWASELTDDFGTRPVRSSGGKVGSGDGRSAAAPETLASSREGSAAPEKRSTNVQAVGTTKDSRYSDGSDESMKLRSDRSRPSSVQNTAGCTPAPVSDRSSEALSQRQAKRQQMQPETLYSSCRLQHMRPPLGDDGGSLASVVPDDSWKRTGNYALGSDEGMKLRSDNGRPSSVQNTAGHRPIVDGSSVVLSHGQARKQQTQPETLDSSSSRLQDTRPSLRDDGGSLASVVTDDFWVRTGKNYSDFMPSGNDMGSSRLQHTRAPVHDDGDSYASSRLQHTRPPVHDDGDSCANTALTDSFWKRTGHYSDFSLARGGAVPEPWTLWTFESYDASKTAGTLQTQADGKFSTTPNKHRSLSSSSQEPPDATPQPTRRGGSGASSDAGSAPRPEDQMSAADGNRCRSGRAAGAGAQGQREPRHSPSQATSADGQASPQERAPHPDPDDSGEWHSNPTDTDSSESSEVAEEAKQTRKMRQKYMPSYSGPGCPPERRRRKRVSASAAEAEEAQQRTPREQRQRSVSFRVDHSSPRAGSSETGRQASFATSSPRSSGESHRSCGASTASSKTTGKTSHETHGTSLDSISGPPAGSRSSNITSLSPRDNSSPKPGSGDSAVTGSLSQSGALPDQRRKESDLSLSSEQRPRGTRSLADESSMLLSADDADCKPSVSRTSSSGRQLLEVPTEHSAAKPGPRASRADGERLEQSGLTESGLPDRRADDRATARCGGTSMTASSSSTETQSSRRSPTAERSARQLSDARHRGLEQKDAGDRERSQSRSRDDVGLSSSRDGAPNRAQMSRNASLAESVLTPRSCTSRASNNRQSQSHGHGRCPSWRPAQEDVLACEEDDDSPLNWPARRAPSWRQDGSRFYIDNASVREAREVYVDDDGARQAREQKLRQLYPEHFGAA
eukprot:TRINITY_DN326_c0_g1_i3.p1 TRINITY_DN326_c0_g1~~TRINITY_DN326_c0_g1_i3.p1  ORF type:complete len:1910 (+),score=270.45 TRINITY_DN326_c0_g1_i3:135-5864(+)